MLAQMVLLKNFTSDFSMAKRTTTIVGELYDNTKLRHPPIVAAQQGYPYLCVLLPHDPMWSSLTVYAFSGQNYTICGPCRFPLCKCVLKRNIPARMEWYEWYIIL